ncbi:MAG: hypothetical protein ABSE45_14950 [Candidatus Acidiferrales bacterium]|jgi:hypothetical protein
MAEKIKYLGATTRNPLDLTTFRDEGYLQEANRRFFHPLGLALELDMETNTLRVWDYREDPEGMIFAEGEDLRPKAQRIADLMHARLAPRMKALSFFVQPAEPFQPRPMNNA